MGFVGVYKALYDYEPQANGELSIVEGDLLLIIEKSTEDDWWKAKKKASTEDADEPEGLVPNNYVEEAAVLGQARALYDYSRQTDEELSFSENAKIQIYDTSDPDWTLVGLDGEYGFVPANYIEADHNAPPPMPSRPRAAEPNTSQDYPSPAASPVQSPAAAIAGIIQQKTGPSSPNASRSAAPPTSAQFTPDASDDEPAPSLPQRPASQQVASPPPEPPGVMASPTFDAYEGSGGTSPGFHLYHIHEMISHLGRNRKMPTTLGINVPKGLIMIAPEKSKDGPTHEWTAEKLSNYSIEGKHVFMELVRPSKSIDFHAGSKDTAHEIVAALGDLAGAARAEGLREVMAASAPSGHKKGVMLYEHMALGDDEVTVAQGDEIVVLDDTQSEEWWSIRRLKNGREGLVPSAYIDITGTTGAAPDVTAQSTRDMNRMEEERLAREALKSSNSNKGLEVGNSLSLPDRHSSLGHRDSDTERTSKKNKRGSRSQSKSGSKPDQSRVRTWTDRSGKFKVDAEFLGLKDNMINLHKVNGVKIAVAVNNMSLEDVEYVERATGQSLDEEKPLSEIKRRNNSKSQGSIATPPSSSGAAVQPPAKDQYDWFDFFLQCGVNPQICERYAGAFSRDQMGEETMQDIDATLLRTLGLKEGDILRVMKFLDNKFGRTRAVTSNGDADGGADPGGLFSGPGGALRNNTRKGRPAPAVQSTDTVDPRQFEQSSLRKDVPPDPSPTPLSSNTTSVPQTGIGFDDDAWDVKPSRAAARSASPAAPAMAAAPAKPAPTGALAELSLLSPPLQPTPAPQPTPSSQSQPSKPSGADPSFFDKLAQSAGQASASRQRPVAPQQAPNQNSFQPPPPQRPLSAPQNQGAFAPPQLRSQGSGSQSQIAPPGQSMNELHQQRTQQQQSFMYPQPTGYPNGMMPQPTGYPQYAQPTGYGQFPPGYQPQQQQFMNGQQTGSPFADPMHAQQTGYQPMQPQATGINAFLPPALQPQPTGMNGYQPNGFGGQNFGQGGFAQQQQQPPPPVPPIPQQQQAPAPLQPQKTGPAPPVRFGVSGGANKLVPQPTGRANLAKATPQNPFGF